MFILSKKTNYFFNGLIVITFSGACAGDDDIKNTIVRIDVNKPSVEYSHYIYSDYTSLSTIREKKESGSWEQGPRFLYIYSDEEYTEMSNKIKLIDIDYYNSQYQSTCSYHDQIYSGIVNDENKLIDVNYRNCVKEDNDLTITLEDLIFKSFKNGSPFNRQDKKLLENDNWKINKLKY